MYGKNTKDKILSCKTLHSFLYCRKKSAQHQRGGTVQSIMLMFWLMSLFLFFATEGGRKDGESRTHREHNRSI